MDRALHDALQRAGRIILGQECRLPAGTAGHADQTAGNRDCIGLRVASVRRQCDAARSKSRNQRARWNLTRPGKCRDVRHLRWPGRPQGHSAHVIILLLLGLSRFLGLLTITLP
jgi:hypothetical protein